MLRSLHWKQLSKTKGNLRLKCEVIPEHSNMVPVRRAKPCEDGAASPAMQAYGGHLGLQVLIFFQHHHSVLVSWLAYVLFGLGIFLYPAFTCWPCPPGFWSLAPFSYKYVTIIFPLILPTASPSSLILSSELFCLFSYCLLIVLTNGISNLALLKQNSRLLACYI